MKELAKNPSVIVGLALGAFISTLNTVTALVVILIIAFAVLVEAIRTRSNSSDLSEDHDFGLKIMSKE